MFKFSQLFSLFFFINFVCSAVFFSHHVDTFYTSTMTQIYIHRKDLNFPEIKLELYAIEIIPNTISN